jgi:hypothetical protein
MRKHVLIGTATAIVLVAGVTTWARQRDERPRVVEAPFRVNDFAQAGDGHLFQRVRIEHVRFMHEGQAEVYLIGREEPIMLQAEEAEALRRAISHPPLYLPAGVNLEPLPEPPLPDGARPKPPTEPPARRDSPFRLLPDPE